MTVEERTGLRCAIDQARRASMAGREAMRARLSRLHAACSNDYSPVDEDTQVLLVQRMLARRVPGGFPYTQSNETAAPFSSGSATVSQQTGA